MSLQPNMCSKHQLYIPVCLGLRAAECTPEEAVMCQAGTTCEPGAKGYVCGKRVAHEESCCLDEGGITLIEVW